MKIKRFPESGIFCKYFLKISDVSQWQITIREREKGVKMLSLQIPKFMHINRQWTSGEDIETSIIRIDSRAHHTQKHCSTVSALSINNQCMSDALITKIILFL